MNVLDMIPITPGSIYIMDRGYMDFERLYNLHQSRGCFFIRARKNLQFYRKNSMPVDRSGGFQFDQLIRLTATESKKKYPQPLRRIHLLDKEDNKQIVLLWKITSNTEKIYEYYKSRWQIELFFKWTSNIYG